MDKLTQNQMEWLKDMLQRGEMTADQANVEKVRMARFIVVSKLPTEVRAALNKAVKTGDLAHKKKDGRKPEVYYHPSFEHLANEERIRIERQTLEAIMGVMAKG